ncbi:hypothetical protein T439DRAFT_347828 [Meredithblackwellia eburnea MCA 4105]
MDLVDQEENYQSQLSLEVQQTRTRNGYQDMIKAAVAPINRLPPETLERIMEFAGGVETIKPLRHWTLTRSTLVASALVCRRWRRPAQRALGLQIAFGFGSEGCHHVDVRRWLSSVQSRDDDAQRFQSRYIGFVAVDGQLVVDVLRRCLSLTKLSLRKFGQDDARDTLLGDWSVFRLPCFANLRWLCIDDDMFEKDPIDVSPLRLPLDTLELTCTEYKPLHTAQFFLALFTGASGTLKHIDLVQDGEQANVDVWSQLEILSDCVQTISLEFGFEFGGKFALPACLNQVRLIKLSGHIWGLEEAGRALCSIADGEYPKLKDLAVKEPKIALKLVLGCSALSALEMLEITTYGDGDTTEIVELKKLAEERGFELVVVVQTQFSAHEVTQGNGNKNGGFPFASPLCFTLEVAVVVDSDPFCGQTHSSFHDLWTCVNDDLNCETN